MPIVLCQVFPSAAAKKRPAEAIKAVNALYRAAVKNDAQVIYLETWPLFADANGDAPVAEFPDLLHPNEAGYAKWAAALRPIFATLGLLETADDPFRPEARLREPVQRTRPDRLGLPADDAGGPGQPRRNGRPRIPTPPPGRSWRRRSPSTGSRPRPTDASP